MVFQSPGGFEATHKSYFYQAAREIDKTLITKQRLYKPNYIIKFSSDEKFTVWDDNDYIYMVTW